MATVIGKDTRHVLECTCRNCASRIEYTRSEVKSYMSSDYGGGVDRVYYLDCPSCGQRIQTSAH